MICSHLLQGASCCKEFGFERALGDMQKGINMYFFYYYYFFFWSETCASFPLKFYLYFLQIFS